ncbi:PAP2 superfamily C-terminal-domain-containing protein [Thamnocephalis sphaerospora]|uniref:PAP2 superfamily C-terminal-domain-containing protein n=1 Tax=Thamnocephalis sphaerospora TaxID=78915 RepID=A0A4P9XYL3_9FUNG|nr:PAP2 superfamily C-terminal-domain-containing protein [Thamnocephalis sphaerospora]|eukprot:RKP10520.1 PAP2 superfamily C-terminal-domain-containing protein [Thamnocephalis sphaerospora]
MASFFHARYEFTVATVSITLVSLALTIFLYMMMNVMGNVASKRSPDNRVVPVLPDAGFEHIGQIKALYLTDVFDFVIIIPAVIYILLHRTPLSCAVQSLTTCSIGCILRITTVAITSFPDPRLDCERIEGDPFASVSLHRCGDAMFSGHTMIFVLGALMWTSFSPLNWAGRIATFLTWCCAIAGGIIIIANRAHYTVDVLVAFYVTVGAWYFVQWWWHHWLVVPNRLVSLRFPHGNYYDARGRKIANPASPELPQHMYQTDVTGSEGSLSASVPSFSQHGAMAELPASTGRSGIATMV